ncbi:GNAT family N-acetyltransferase [Kocuria sp.]|uniref:GNAT family N-acetyltransferase n=1 Tax=Kocuria sp. TaxID=1871328 RepID=UPI0026E0D79F|nr:GNAT family N-acetyltransferase [Kocuria sp.]
MITTDRLRLTVPQDADVDAVFEIHSDLRTSRHRPDLVMRSRAQAVALIEGWQADWTADGIGYFVVSTLAGDRIGFAGARRSVEKDEAVLNLYYRFAPRAQGHGYAAEATRAVLAWAEGVSAKRPIVAVIDPSNAASVRLALTLGMHRDPAGGTPGVEDLYRF